MSFWWNDYVGIPYRQHGRNRAGADCWGLVRLVYAEQFDHDLPSFSEAYADSADERIVELLAKHREGWDKVDDPQPGDVVLFKVIGQLAHVGIAAAPGTFLHAREGHAATIERLESGSWKHRIEGFYRYRDKAATNTVTIAAMPHPLRTDRIDGMMPAGMSVRKMVEEIHAKTGISGPVAVRNVVMVDGRIVPAKDWDLIPSEGQRVELRCVAAGDVGRTLLTIAVVLVAAYYAPTLFNFAPGAMGTAAAQAAGYGVYVAGATAALTAAGMLLVNSIFPIRMPDMGLRNDPKQAARQNLLQGGRNVANQYGAIPVVLGQYRYTPPLGAVAYVESGTTTSYLREPLVWGYGPLQVSDLRVGENSLDEFEEIQYQTLTGQTGESTTQFDSIYAQDVQQDYVNVTLETKQGDISAASRTSNVITVTTTALHGIAVNAEVTLTLTSGSTISGTVATVPTTTTFTFANTGANGSIAAASYLASSWTERTISDPSTSLRLELHFPAGLRRIVTSGENAGDVEATPFRAAVEIRPLNSATLAPIGPYVNPTETVNAAGPFVLQSAWANTDTDAALERAYQWTRITVDSDNNIIVRKGSVSNSKTADPSGALLTRLYAAIGQTFNAATGNTKFKLLPAIDSTEVEICRICVFGDAIDSLVDFRPASVTGCAVTTSGLNFSVAAGTVTRTTSVIAIGGDGEPFAKRRDAFTYSKTFIVPLGCYQVRIRRTNAAYVTRNSRQYYHTGIFLTLTGYELQRPITPPKPLAMTAVRLKATNQFNGNIDGIWGTAISIAKDWDSTTSTWVTRPTRNPASLYRLILQHPGNAQAVADSEIDLTALAEWHSYCTTNSFMFDMVVSDQRSLLDVMRDVCAAGRASPTIMNGQWSIVVDKPRTVVSQFFTPHNSWGFESTRALPNLPHAFRVQFANSEKGYQPDEMIVYNDGYSAANATLFEGLSLPGVTTTAAIYKHARFHLAQLKLRPETYTINADIEHLICTRGDLVRVTHDVPLWGVGSGRIRNRTSSTVLELDEPVQMTASTQYTIRIRLEDGTSITRTVAAKTTDGYYSSILLTTSVTTTEGKAGNLFMIGALSSESVELIVQSIEPSDNMTARLTLVDYSPAVYNVDSEPIPAFNSQIMLPQLLQQSNITEAPVISSIVSDESVLVVLAPGRYQVQIMLSYTNPATLPYGVMYIEAQIKASGDISAEWSRSQALPVNAGSVYFADVIEGAAYVVRLRYADDLGKVGPWTESPAHTIIGKTTPPSSVSALTATPQGTMLRLAWTGAPEPDVIGYEVRLTDSGFGTDGYVFRGSTSSVLVEPPAVGASTNWYVRAFDAANLYSTASTAVTYTTAALPNITAITATFADTSLTNATVTLDWANVSPAFGLGGYQVSYGSVTKVVNANTITLPADWIGNRAYTIKTLDQRGNLSSGFTSSLTKLAPNPPTGVRAQVIDNNVLLYWTEPVKTTLPIAHILLKEGAAWATATTIGTKSGSFTSLAELQAGAYTYWLAAVDTDGYESTPVSLGAQVAEPPDFIFQGERGSTFAGTRLSAVLDNGGVIIPANTSETWATHFSSRGWANIAAQISAGYPIYIQPTPAAGSYTETFDFGTILASSRVSVAYTGATVGGTPVVIPKIELSPDNVTWQVFDGVTDAFGTNFRYVRFTLTVTGDGDEVYQLSSLNVTLSSKLKNDGGNTACLSTDASGTVANFNLTFIDVTSVTVTAAGTSPVTAVYDLKDANQTGTYSIAAGVVTVNATAHGFVAGQAVRLMPTSGEAAAQTVIIATVPSANQFTANTTSAVTSGNVSIYPQSMRIYLFNSSGSRVSANASWSIKGY